MLRLPGFPEHVQQDMIANLCRKDPEFHVCPVAAVQQAEYQTLSKGSDEVMGTMMWPNLNKHGRQKFRNGIRQKGYDMCLDCAKIYDPKKEEHTCGEKWGGRDSCLNCGNKRGLKACAVCGLATYCSKDCQKAHWSDHKLVCRPTKILRV